MLTLRWLMIFSGSKMKRSIIKSRKGFRFNIFNIDYIWQCLTWIRHYPRTNNESVLEFVFEKDPNLFLRKNKILIRGFIEVDKKYMVENGWPSKLFAQLTVEVNSQSVSKNVLNFWWWNYCTRIKQTPLFLDSRFHCVP